MNESIHGERTTSEPQDRVSELSEQLTAISEVLRAIASSPHDLRPIFDAILDSATGLCRADIGALRLSEESGLRLVAMRGDPSLISHWSSIFPALAEKGSFLSRLATRRVPTHIPDLTALEGDFRDDYWNTAMNAGFGTGLVVPLLKDNEVIGLISVGRKLVQPFTDKQISLFGDFAAQATIALESTRRERQYREMLRQSIETVPAFLWSTGPDGEPTHISQRVLDYSGMRLEDFQHGGWEEFMHPADFPETVKAFSHAIRTGTSYQAVHRLRRAADGEYRWHHARGEPLRDQGRIVQWYGLSVDIDESKKAEGRLHRSEGYLAEAQRLSHTGSAAYNETEILYWSEEASRIWGFDPLRGVPSREAVWQRIHPDDLDGVNENIERGVREKRSFANEFRIILPDGTVKHLEAANNPVFSASGELLEIVVTGLDVTERKRAEQTLRESEAKFRDYAETASDWFWEIGPDYKFTLLTENAFGSNSAGRIATTCWDHALDLETEPEKWRLVWETLDSRKPFRDFVYCALGGNGSPMYVKASGKPVFDAGGGFRGYRGTGTDVTGIMHAEEALRESERSLRSAIDGIAGLVVVLAPNGELETVNRQVLEYFGPIAGLGNEMGDKRCSAS